MDRIKLSFPDKEREYEWIVNGKAVICNLECYINLKIDDHYIDKLRRLFPHVGIRWSGIYFNVSGIAKCHVNDNYDLDYGKKLSESRAKAKAYSIANRLAYEYSCLVMDDMSEVSAFLYDMSNQHDHELDHIEYLKDNG